VVYTERRRKNEMKEGEFSDWVMIIGMLMFTGYLLYVTLA
jgi:hypothetical protein